jgi:hypothetical protein
MVNLRLVFLFTALACANGRSRGVRLDGDEQPLADGLAEDREIARLLKGSKESNMKNLATGATVNKQKGGGSAAGGSNVPYREPTGNTGSNTGGVTSTGGDTTSVVLQESFPCVQFDGDVEARASLSLSDEACRANGCSGGCCRVYHWLICDAANEMPNLACVCNENTQLPPTSAPIPVTAAPIPVTAAPIPVTTAPIPVTAAPVIPVTAAPIPITTPNPTAAATPSLTPGPTKPWVIDVNPIPATSNPITSSSGSQATKPPFVGGAAPDACSSGSTLHNNPQFIDFTRCFSSDDCSQAHECCIHTFCFCGEPDAWDLDCVAPATDIQK